MSLVKQNADQLVSKFSEVNVGGALLKDDFNCLAAVLRRDGAAFLEPC